MKEHDMDEVRDGLWRWTAPHPDWTPKSDWDQQVGCWAHASGEGLVLIDPLTGGEWEPLEALVESVGPVAGVIVTVGWHDRDAAEAAQRYGVEVFAPQLGRELPGAKTIADGQRLPGEIQALVVEEGEEALLYLAAARTLLAGDLLMADEGRLRLCPASWLENEEDFPQARAGVARALELPLEAVAVSHGEPALFEGRAPLEEALSRG